MKTSKILLVLLFVFGQTLTQCCRCPRLYPYFDIHAVKSIDHVRSQESPIQGHIGHEEEIDTIEYAGFIIRFEYEYVAEKTQTNTGGALYACSCDDQIFTPAKEKVTEITVITLHDFDENLNAGDTINSFLRDRYSEKSISDFIAEEQPLTQEHIFFKVSKFPTADPRFQVKVIIKLDSGEVYETTSLTVVFKG